MTRSRRAYLVAVLLIGGAGGPLACMSGSSDGGSAGASGTACSALSACCALLPSGEAQTCEATVKGAGVTDATCASALATFQSAGACGSDAGARPATADSGGSSIDAGAKGDSGSVAAGCVGLSACCPALPASQLPSECYTVATMGTDTACDESLAGYKGNGYCGGGGVVKIGPSEPVDSGVSVGEAVPEAYVLATLSVTGDAAGCDIPTPFLAFGSLTRPVAGSQVSCTVRENPQVTGLFEVDVSVAASETTDGFTLSANVRNDAATPNSVSLVELPLAPAPNGSYGSNAGCTIAFAGDPKMGVYPGRIYGTLSCPYVGGGASGHACSGSVSATATFMFENCD